jgi:hypothetical protein
VKGDSLEVGSLMSYRTIEARMGKCSLMTCQSLLNEGLEIGSLTMCWLLMQDESRRSELG